MSNALNNSLVMKGPACFICNNDNYKMVINEILYCREVDYVFLRVCRIERIKKEIKKLLF